MNAPANCIPVVLFAYARTDHLARTLVALRANAVPLLIAYADGAKGAADAARVAEVRALLRSIDWCEVRLVERAGNFGLGRNILAGVTEVAAQFEAFIVWEDDLVGVPGTYDWLCAALRHYAGDARVMSVTGWTHPRVTPAGLEAQPYFDARAECWVWGTWARSWLGMGETATEKMHAAEQAGWPRAAYGTDLPAMAAVEERKNIWAVRWLYHHLQHRGLCLRPPWSLVEHIGFDAGATNAAGAGAWANPPLQPAPPLAVVWPAAVEHPDCRALWAAANPGRWIHRWRRLRGYGRRWWRRFFGWRWFRGHYPDWPAARAASAGYDAAAEQERVVAATRAVESGGAAWERDGWTFDRPASNEPLLATLRAVAAGSRRDLDVVDFGGALGSTWRQHRRELAGIGPVRWRVVEQPAYVAAGAEFANEQLTFHDSIEGALGGAEPHMILFSSVLPYVEDPRELLATAVRRGFPHIVIDRTPLVAPGRGRLTVQHTPPALGGGSYPCRLFERDELLAPLLATHVLVREWAALDDLAADVQHRGFHFRRKA